MRSSEREVSFAINRYVNERKLSSSKLCRQICVIRDKRPKVGMRLSLTYINVSLTCTYVACYAPSLRWTLFIRTYVHTFRDTEIPIHIDAQSANMRATAK